MGDVTNTLSEPALHFLIQMNSLHAQAIDSIVHSMPAREEKHFAYNIQPLYPNIPLTVLYNQD